MTTGLHKEYSDSIYLQYIERDISFLKNYYGDDITQYSQGHKEEMLAFLRIKLQLQKRLFEASGGDLSNVRFLSEKRKTI